MSTLFLRRSALALSRRTALKPLSPRPFTTYVPLRQDTKDTKSGDPDPQPEKPEAKMIPFEEVKTAEDLLPPGAKVGTMPTDLEQSTGLERLEILGKMQGVDVFDMRPLDSSRTGTMTDPIMVNSFGDEQYCGCTGCPADSHHTVWLTISRDRPIGRCPECGSVYKMVYIGPPDDPHGHGHHDPYEEPKTFADYIPEKYRYI